ncbi:MAG: TIGR02099 family protein [Betaproteobacteria bacterium]|nr:TIGR02099 family protein [Betaproteobacteria bacterium]
MLNLRAISFALRSFYWLARLALYGVAAASIGFGIALLAFRYWLLPNVEQYREDIAAAISRAAGQKVTIGAIEAGWDGLRPHLGLRNVQVLDRDGRPALSLSRIENTLSWESLLFLEPRFQVLEIDRPALDVRRDSRGVIHVAGIALNRSSEEAGFSDWLLRQTHLIVNGASITWRDELRGAPPLELASVSLRIENHGRRHRFGLKAVPPAQLAAPLEVRGDLSGAAVAGWREWQGEVFAQFDYADIAAWRTWIPFPAGLVQGRGALRAWVKFDDARITELTADLALAEARARLGPELPEIAMTGLQGRLGWRRLDGGMEVFTRGLALVTRQGIAIPPADFLLRLIEPRGTAPGRGELRANALDLEPLANLAGYLPLEESVRERLTRLAPRGSLYDVAANWKGEWPAPKAYSVKGRFADLGLRAYGAIPAFSGLSGNIDGDEDGGSVNLSSSRATIELPGVFRDPLGFETLTAQSRWRARGGQTELELSNVSFSSAQLAGSVFGSYRTVAGGPGIIDLTGSLTRADARFVNRYVPLVVNPDARAWLDRAILAGNSQDVRLRLKGNLADFPFADGSRGVFQVTARVSGGTLLYGEGWPRIENLVADLAFRGARMEVAAQQGTIYGAKLAKVRAVIPDLMASEEAIEIDGDAEGPTGEFLKFIEASPVRGYVDHFTEGMRAAGSGKLHLKLRIPPRHIEDTKVAGTFQFLNNQVTPGPDLPALERVNGRIEFSESEVKAQNISAQILGSPATLNAATQRDGGVRIGIAGRLTADGLQKSLGWPVLKSLRGGAEWRSVVTVKKRLTQFTVDSPLTGLASDLPPPFAKAASEVVPLRFERSASDPGQDTVAFSYGRVVSAQFLRVKSGDQMKTERGVISFGATPAAPARSGIWLNGALASLDLDRWREVLGPGGAGPALDIGGIDLRFGRLDFLGRRFGELHVNGASQEGIWRASLRGREINGDVEWRSHGKGKITARLKSLTIPVATSERPSVPQARDGDLPGLDVTAENFTFKDRQLGKLELAAQPEGTDWRIDRLRIAVAEGAIQADGLWQGWLTTPRTQMNLKLELTDIGKFLARLGFPDGVKRGNGKLEGTLTWAGSPQSPDYPSLSGTLALEARNGQFAKMDPGLGKLLGILSLQALPRRIVLDFRDVFSEGFEFDTITGTAKIAQGVANTQDLIISGSAAKVEMKGEMDLARESQNLRVRVAPALGQGVGLAGSLIGGPAVGVAALIVSKVLKDPLDQIVAYEYNVTGTWSDPVVSKIGSPPQQSESR